MDVQKPLPDLVTIKQSVVALCHRDKHRLGTTRTRDSVMILLWRRLAYVCHLKHIFIEKYLKYARKVQLKSVLHQL